MDLQKCAQVTATHVGLTHLRAEAQLIVSDPYLLGLLQDPTAGIKSIVSVWRELLITD